MPADKQDTRLLHALHFPPEVDQATAARLGEHFEAVGGGAALYEAMSRSGKAAVLNGAVRLKERWTSETVVRMRLEDYDRLQIRLFQAGRGTVLVYRAGGGKQWVGYTVRRRREDTAPSQWILAGTDGGRNRRTGASNHDVYQLTCRDGEAVLSRGDIALLRLPFEGLPDEVGFQGKAVIAGFSLDRIPPESRGVGLWRAGEWALAGEPRPVGSVGWVQPPDDGGRREMLADGGVRLATVAGRRSPSWAAMPRPRDACGELLLEIEDPSPGTGIYLGDGVHAPRWLLRYVRDLRSGSLCLVPGSRETPAESEFPAVDETVLPSVLPRHWLRLVFGVGQWRWSISTDGHSWAEPFAPQAGLPADATHVGLYCGGGPAGQAITCRRVMARNLPQLAADIGGEAKRGGRGFAEARSLEAWLAAVDREAPAGIALREWRHACAWKTLAEGSVAAPLGNALVLWLLDDLAEADVALERQVARLQEGALLLQAWDDRAVVDEWARRFHAAGMRAFEREGVPPFSSIRRAIQTAPLATRLDPDVAPEGLLRAELIGLVYDHRWKRVREFAQELRCFQLQSRSPLLDWAETVAWRHAPAGGSVEGRPARRVDEWGEILVEELDREVYAVLAQLRSEMQAPDRDDAARTLAALSGPRAGVAPHWSDRDLLVSLTTAVRSAMQGDTPLPQRMAASFSDLARLRVGEALARARISDIEFAALQFTGTEAAADAHVFLGDRWLADGRFAAAAEQYASSLPTLAPQRRTTVRAKQRLAATLAAAAYDPGASGGVAAGAGSPGPPAGAAQPEYGAAPEPARSTAAEFEQLAANVLAGRPLREDSLSPGSADTFGGVILPAAVPPGIFQMEPRTRLDGLAGDAPQRATLRDLPLEGLDWVGRQLGITVDRQWMYVSNRFHVAAYDRDRKQRVWQTAAPPGQMQFAQKATFTASRPVLDPEALFVRLCYTPGHTVACVDRQSGEFVWTYSPQASGELIADPIRRPDGVTVLLLARVEQQESVLRRVTLDARTGFVWREQDLVRLRESWWQRRYGERLVWDGGVVIALGGVVLSLDDVGEIRWIRRQIVMPAREEPHWVRQHFQPPLLDGRRLYVAQPGVQVVECLEVETGERLWSQRFLDVERMVGVVGAQVILQTSCGLIGLDKVTGDRRWMHAATSLLEGVAPSGLGDIIYAQRVAGGGSGGLFHTRLVWVDAVTGIPRGSCELPAIAGESLELGPLIPYRDGLWTLWSRRTGDPVRDVIELVRQHPAP